MSPPGVGVDFVDHGGGSGGVVQARGDISSRVGVHRIAREGIRGPGRALPHLDVIERSFGRDMSHVRAHLDGRASAANRAIGSRAYTTGSHIAFSAAPDLNTAAHEAAHVVQQMGDVRLADGIGRRGDVYERHADAVAARVVRGDSARDLVAPRTLALPTSGVSDGDAAPVQMKEEMTGVRADPILEYLRGESRDDGSGMVGLCDTKTTVRYLPRGYRPRFINETIPGGSTSCLNGQGTCRPIMYSVPVMRNHGSEDKPNYQEAKVKASVGCECQIKVGSPLQKTAQERDEG